MLYNCNVIVTKPTNHMTSIRDHSHDPNTWPTNFILTSRHHRFQLPHHHLSRHQVIIDSDIRVTISMSWFRLSLLHHQSTRLQPIVRGPRAGARKSYFQINAYPGSSGGNVKRVTLIAINKSYWWEPWWVMSRTASWTLHKPDSRERQHQLQPSTILPNG